MTKATASSREDDPVTGAGSTVFQSSVSRHSLFWVRIVLPKEIYQLTAHRIEAAALLSNPSGMGVTCRT